MYPIYMYYPMYPIYMYYPNHDSTGVYIQTMCGKTERWGPNNSAVLMSPMLGRKSEDHTITYLYHKQFTLLYYIPLKLGYSLTQS